MSKDTDNNLPLTCPVCDQSLSWGDRVCLCDQGHTYDLAKEGYVNLLLSHSRRSKHPGDNADMVQARRRFVDSGGFTQLAELIQSEICRFLEERETTGHIDILDSGCGEGYLLSELQNVLTGEFYGIDVSKEAIRLASRRHKGSRWIVGNVMRRIPFTSDSLDVVLSVLAPRNVDELARILKLDGHLFLVVPGADHLVELRSQLMASMGNFQTKTDEAIELCTPHFDIQQKKSLTYEVLLNRELLSDLVQMTPMYWQSSREAKKRLDTLEELRVTMNFVLLVFTLKRLN